MKLTDTDSENKQKIGFKRYFSQRGFFSTLLLWFLGISLIPLAITIFINYKSAFNSLDHEAKDKLIITAENRANEIQFFFQQSLDNLLIMASRNFMNSMANDFKTSFEKSGLELPQYVKSPQWQSIAEIYDDEIGYFITTHDYQDIFLIDSVGNILFTDKKENDLGTNIFNGKYSNTLLGKSCREAFENEFPTFSDFEIYSPSGNMPACFLITLIYNENIEKTGLLAVQISNTKIEQIMRSRIGLGEKGECYLIGSDLRMRSNSMLEEKPTILGPPVKTEQTLFWKENYVERECPLVRIKQNTRTYIGRQGIKVYGLYKPIEIANVRMAVLTEIPESETLHAARVQKNIALFLFILTIMIVFALAIFVAKRITQPVKKLSDWALKVAAGDLSSQEISTPQNEIGQLNMSFRKVVTSLQVVADVCIDISKGLFERSVEIRSEQDVLGKAVNQMGKNLKEANEDSQKKISYLNKIPTTVHVIDMDFNVQFINETGAKMLNKTVDECIGKKCYDLFNTIHCNTRNCRASMAINFDKVLTGDTTADLRGTANLPIRYTSAPIKDNEQNIIGAIEYMIDIIDEYNVIKLAEKVSQGDYDTNIELRSEDDRLGITLVNMTKALRETSSENQRNNWFKTGQTELAEVMRGDKDVNTLSRDTIVFLAKYLDVQVGTFYLAQENGNLKLTGTYAFTKRKGLVTDIKLGEGLVGEAAFEKESILISEVPEDYIRVESSLGNALPRNILATPLILRSQVIGVIELGSFNAFRDRQIEFLKIVSENIAIAINSAQESEKTKRLLEQTQNQAEELQTQQEELETINEELREQTERLQKSEEQLKAQQEELEVTNEELEEKTHYLEQQKQEIVEKNRNLKLAQHELEQKAKELEITSKYKSEFLANMSHELRTPLNSLLLLARDLTNNKEKNLTQVQVESAEIIYNSGNDLLKLINEILDLSKIEAGKMTLHLENVLLADVVKTINSNFKHIIVDKNLDLIINIGENLPVSIQTDSQRLDQVIRNLLSNAIKFTEKGQIKVDFHKPSANIDLSRSGLIHKDSIAIAVTDTGIGIPEDKKLQIFEAFQQVDGSISRQYGGTGLGLSISRELTKLLGGEIQLESQLGKGSTFTIYLPIEFEKFKKEKKDTELSHRQKTEITADEKRVTISASGKIKNFTPAAAIPDDRENINENDRIILIIEDDLNFAKILCKTCHDTQFKCIHASDGESGLALAAQYVPDAIILDIKLPGVDGWGVLEALKDNSKTRHIPVHMMSVEEETIDAFKKGAIGYLTKPVTKKQLEKAFAKIENFIATKPKNLLIVEDDASLRKSIIRLIGNGDVNTMAVGKGEEAIKELNAKTYDCMILDLNLPDISGFEVLKKLDQNKELTIPPVIVYTGKELTKEEEYKLQEFASSIIVKGVKSDERLLDETALFLHRIVDDLPSSKKKIISRMHNDDYIFMEKKILVVDDDMRNVFAISKILKDKGMNVFKAANGKKALEILETEPGIDIVLMDIMMPVMDGYETIQKIRTLERFWKLPILALTAKAMKEDREKCISAGANDYLLKPVEMDRLLSLIRVWLYK